jgi:hypothetical protein
MSRIYSSAAFTAARKSPPKSLYQRSPRFPKLWECDASSRRFLRRLANSKRCEDAPHSKALRAKSNKPKENILDKGSTAHSSLQDELRLFFSRLHWGAQITTEILYQRSPRFAKLWECDASSRRFCAAWQIQSGARTHRTPKRCAQKSNKPKENILDEASIAHSSLQDELRLFFGCLHCGTQVGNEMLVFAFARFLVRLAKKR